jgi:hypothetical protein
VAALVSVGLVPADLAVATGANKRTAAIWVDDAQRDPKKKTHKRRLAELKEVTRLVVENGTIAYQEADWLRHPNRGAEFKTPLQLIRNGDWKEAVRIYCDDVAIPIPPAFSPTRGNSSQAKGSPNSVGAP